MIVRIWRGRAATAENAEGYERHIAERVFPSVAALPGHRGAQLLRREVEGGVEFLAVTWWESIEAVQAFAGPEPDVAVVEPEARAVLADFDDFVRHFELAHSANFG